MRAYFFTNMYISSLQCGLQSQHCTAALFVRYNNEGNKKDILYDWATNHKTTIILNGGPSVELQNLTTAFNTGANPYPWESFNESVDALGGIMTCVGIILPPRIYELAALVRERAITPEVIKQYVGPQQSDNTTERLLNQLSTDTFDVADSVATLVPFERELILRLPKYGLAS